jgi:hypothetical protein
VDLTGTFKGLGTEMTYKLELILWIPTPALCQYALPYSIVLLTVLGQVFGDRTTSVEILSGMFGHHC